MQDAYKLLDFIAAWDGFQRKKEKRQKIRNKREEKNQHKPCHFDHMPQFMLWVINATYHLALEWHWNNAENMLPCISQGLVWISTFPADSRLFEAIDS